MVWKKYNDRLDRYIINSMERPINPLDIFMLPLVLMRYIELKLEG